MANIGKMEYAFDLSRGDDQPLIMEFYIAVGTAIEMGEVVKLVDGAIVAVGDADQDDPYLGVATENHDGATPGRQTGNAIKVYCSPTAVFKCRPNIVSTADSGSGTTWVDGELVASAGYSDDLITGGYLKVKTTTALTDAINKAIRITDFTVAAGTITGVFTGGVTAGDTALIFPPVGSKGWDFNSDGTNLDLKAAGGESVQVIRVDTVNEIVYWKFRLHQFANYMVAI